MADCLFCKIAAREIDAKIVHEDERAVAFEDINPAAPTHLLVIPRRHIDTLNDATAADEEALGHCVTVAGQLAQARGIAAPGWRLVANCNAGAGQTVFHVHFHVLGGRTMGWPPG